MLTKRNLGKGRTEEEEWTFTELWESVNFEAFKMFDVIA